MCRVGVFCARYLIRVCLGLGFIEFILLSHFASACGCMSSCLGLGLWLELGRDVLVLFSCFEFAGLEFVLLGI